MKEQFQSKLFGKVQIHHIHDFFNGTFWEVELQDGTDFKIRRHYNPETKTDNEDSCLLQCNHAYEVVPMPLEMFAADIQCRQDEGFKLWLYSTLAALKYKNELAMKPKPKPADFECSDFIRRNVFRRFSYHSQFGTRLYMFLFPNDLGIGWFGITLPLVRRVFQSLAGTDTQSIKIEQKTTSDHGTDAKSQSNVLTQKWQSTGLLQGVFNDSERDTMAQLLENQAKQLLEQVDIKIYRGMDPWWKAILLGMGALVRRLKKKGRKCLNAQT